ncbi:hypothetical protein QPL79_08910 [Ignisphaera sp. 4213-co]|uniref:Uncharacterized protein n=1 Tax=Ignisphaera cupida TaxID=3050454 RepID=A0ABD4Z7Z9_9CREN|nr:hypothetical protein [Ignisphaera sp. 4213-co]MDK6029482.1 hypothetical protein [Ignisphaera sp. 4213-co]
MSDIMIEKRRRKKRKLMITDNKVVFRKRLEHQVELSPEVSEWAKANLDLLDWLVFDSAIASSLRHPHSVRTLIYLLYARANGIPIAQIAKAIDVAHEQLYRLERLLSRAGIKDFVYKMLKPLPKQQ